MAKVTICTRISPNERDAKLQNFCDQTPNKLFAGDTKRMGEKQRVVDK